MSIYTGWSEQYDRMLRSHRHLVEIANGETTASSDQARDAFIHFFQDAYHVKDWLKNDLVAMNDEVEEWISNNPTLALCADLANGSKHYALKAARTGDTSAAAVSQNVTVRPGPVGHPAKPHLHAWTVQSQGQSQDALRLADDVVREWRSWLRHQGLTSAKSTA